MVELYERDQDVWFPVKGRARTQPWIKWVNTALTLAVILAISLMNIAPPEFAFMIGVSLHPIINFKSVDLVAHEKTGEDKGFNAAAGMAIG